MDQKWQLMSSFIQVREKGTKKAKKMDFAQTKTDIYMNNKSFYQKSAGLRFLPVWYNLKKKKKFDFGQKWKSMSSFARKAQI